MKRRHTASTVACGVARGLEVVGDAWTLLILRDVFWGINRFDALQRDLGIASNILSSRLQRLESDGILERREYHEVPPRVEYEPTQKAVELYPVLLALKDWGDRWQVDAGRSPAYRQVHRPCGHELHAQTVCAHCGEQLAPQTVARELATDAGYRRSATPPGRSAVIGRRRQKTK